MKTKQCRGLQITALLAPFFLTCAIAVYRLECVIPTLETPEKTLYSAIQTLVMFATIALVLLSGNMFKTKEND